MYNHNPVEAFSRIYMKYNYYQFDQLIKINSSIYSKVSGLITWYLNNNNNTYHASHW